jgi:hypothetical protein
MVLADLACNVSLMRSKVFSRLIASLFPVLAARFSKRFQRFQIF